MEKKHYTSDMNPEHEAQVAFNRIVNCYPEEVAAQAIFTDICDRKGLKNEFLNLDEEWTKHIIYVWKRIIYKSYEKFERKP